eukprot:TRINITY_DN1790_c0_g2_i2.p1 TRINITY_DN1790_c0_g2~~TRINITY_DN1790_c0_g2_i2.p1  ORF type:complete len:1697 (+),score=705.09 TRINITY_DN1790_c0_g2_i2:528-5093(+)
MKRDNEDGLIELVNLIGSQKYVENLFNDSQKKSNISEDPFELRNIQDKNIEEVLLFYLYPVFILSKHLTSIDKIREGIDSILFSLFNFFLSEPNFKRETKKIFDYLLFILQVIKEHTPIRIFLHHFISKYLQKMKAKIEEIKQTFRNDNTLPNNKNVGGNIYRNLQFTDQFKKDSSSLPYPLLSFLKFLSFFYYKSPPFSASFLEHNSDFLIKLAPSDNKDVFFSSHFIQLLSSLASPSPTTSSSSSSSSVQHSNTLSIYEKIESQKFSKFFTIDELIRYLSSSKQLDLHFSSSILTLLNNLIKGNEKVRISLVHKKNFKDFFQIENAPNMSKLRIELLNILDSLVTNQIDVEYMWGTVKRFLEGSLYLEDISKELQLASCECTLSLLQLIKSLFLNSDNKMIVNLEKKYFAHTQLKNSSFISHFVSFVRHIFLKIDSLSFIPEKQHQKWKLISLSLQIFNHILLVYDKDLEVDKLKYLFEDPPNKYYNLWYLLFSEFLSINKFSSLLDKVCYFLKVGYSNNEEENNNMNLTNNNNNNNNNININNNILPNRFSNPPSSSSKKHTSLSESKELYFYTYYETCIEYCLRIIDTLFKKYSYYSQHPYFQNIFLLEGGIIKSPNFLINDKNKETILHILHYMEESFAQSNYLDLYSIKNLSHFSKYNKDLLYFFHQKKALPSLYKKFYNKLSIPSIQYSEQNQLLAIEILNFLITDLQHLKNIYFEKIPLHHLPPSSNSNPLIPKYLIDLPKSTLSLFLLGFVNDGKIELADDCLISILHILNDNSELLYSDKIKQLCLESIFILSSNIYTCSRIFESFPPSLDFILEKLYSLPKLSLLDWRDIYKEKEEMREKKQITILSYQWIFKIISLQIHLSPPSSNIFSKLFLPPFYNNNNNNSSVMNNGSSNNIFSIRSTLLPPLPLLSEMGEKEENEILILSILDDILINLSPPPPPPFSVVSPLLFQNLLEEIKRPSSPLLPLYDLQLLDHKLDDLNYKMRLQNINPLSIKQDFDNLKAYCISSNYYQQLKSSLRRMFHSWKEIVQIVLVDKYPLLQRSTPNLELTLCQIIYQLLHKCSKISTPLIKKNLAQLSLSILYKLRSYKSFFLFNLNDLLSHLLYSILNILLSLILDSPPNHFSFRSICYNLLIHFLHLSFLSPPSSSSSDSTNNGGTHPTMTNTTNNAIKTLNEKISECLEQKIELLLDRLLVVDFSNSNDIDKALIFSLLNTLLLNNNTNELIIDFFLQKSYFSSLLDLSSYLLSSKYLLKSPPSSSSLKEGNLNTTNFNNSTNNFNNTTFNNNTTLNNNTTFNHLSNNVNENNWSSFLSSPTQVVQYLYLYQSHFSLLLSMCETYEGCFLLFKKGILDIFQKFEFINLHYQIVNQTNFVPPLPERYNTLLSPILSLTSSLLTLLPKEEQVSLSVLKFINTYSDAFLSILDENNLSSLSDLESYLQINRLTVETTENFNSSQKLSLLKQIKLILELLFRFSSSLSCHSSFSTCPIFKKPILSRLCTFSSFLASFNSFE